MLRPTPSTPTSRSGRLTARALALALPLTLGLGVLAPSPAAALIDPGTGTSYDPAPVTLPMTFPVAGSPRHSDTWLVCRSGCARKHMGQDIMGRKMTPLLAAFDGVVTTLSKDGSSGNYVGITGNRGATAGWTALYLHVNNDTPGTDDGKGSERYAFPGGIERGARVVAGQLIGWLGDSGNAESTGAHLHVELRQGSGWGGVVRNMHPSLVKARRLAAPLPSGPHPDGSLLRHPNGALFLVDGERKRPVSTTVLAATGRSAASAIPMTSAESLTYSTLPPVALRDGVVVRDPAGTTWLTHGGVRSRAGTDALAALGLSAPRVFPVTDADLAATPEGELPTTALYDGALVRVDGEPQVHLIEDGRTRALSASVFASHGFSGRDVALLPADAVPLLAALRADDPLPLRDGTVVQTRSHVVAVIGGGQARRLWDSRMVRDYGYTGKPRLLVADDALAGWSWAPLTG